MRNGEGTGKEVGLRTESRKAGRDKRAMLVRKGVWKGLGATTKEKEKRWTARFKLYFVSIQTTSSGGTMSLVFGPFQRINETNETNEIKYNGPPQCKSKQQTTNNISIAGQLHKPIYSFC